jgi:endo-1,4-beta-xylanase
MKPKTILLWCGILIGVPLVVIALVWILAKKTPQDVASIGLAQVATIGDPAQLKNALLQKGIYFGTFLNGADMASKAPRPAGYLDTINSYMNVFTAQTYWTTVHAKQGVYNFATPDAVADFAMAHGAKIRLHNLVWDTAHMPAWVTQGNFTPDELAAILKDHIQTVVTHFRDKYPGVVLAIDVVNEPISSVAGREDGLRHDFIWSAIHMPGSDDPTDFIVLALQWAREADPNAELFINTNGNSWHSRIEANQEVLVKRLLERGAQLDGVGFESHVTMNYEKEYPFSTLTEIMNELADMGLKTQITEMDVPITTAPSYSWPTAATAIPIPSPGQAELDAQARVYRGFLGACIAAKSCNAFVTWGVFDPTSWVDTSYHGLFYADLFDKNMQPKPALLALFEEVGATAPIPPETPPDTTPPTITLSGPNPYTVTNGDTYTDPGASAHDDHDGSLAVSVDTSALNVDVSGTYTIQYRATDAAGNTAHATRTVIVAPHPADDTDTDTDEDTSPDTSTDTHTDTTQGPIIYPINTPVGGTVISADQSLDTPVSERIHITVTQTIPQTTTPSTTTKPTTPTLPVLRSVITAVDYILDGSLSHRATTFPDTWELDTTTLTNDWHTLLTIYHHADESTTQSIKVFKVQNHTPLWQVVWEWVRGIVSKIF